MTPNEKQPVVGIVHDEKGWHERFCIHGRELGIKCELFDIGRSDWIDRVRNYECVVWRPGFEHPDLAHAREKIYFMEHVLGKRVFPNWSTFWHYDNKKAEAYLLTQSDLPTPETFISYSREEAESYLRTCRYPIVAKTSGGAASRGVRLLKDAKQANRYVQQAFGNHLKEKVWRRLGYQYPQRLDTSDSYVLWQEFIENNDRDCRMTVLNGRYVYVLYRRNRPGDFRASGSGLLVYDGPPRETEIRALTQFCRHHKFDSMAFDLLFRDSRFYVTETSYTHPIAFLDQVPGHYVVSDDDEVTYREDCVQPQRLQMEYVRSWIEQPQGPVAEQKASPVTEGRA